jgi:hypothetical protein
LLQLQKEIAMIKAPSRSDSYREYLMKRGDFSPLEYGIALTKDALTDVLVDEFNSAFKGLSIDEVCLRPKVALYFCDTVRQKHGFFDLPDDCLLRCIMNRRKASNS